MPNENGKLGSLLRPNTENSIGERPLNTLLLAGFSIATIWSGVVGELMFRVVHLPNSSQAVIEMPASVNGIVWKPLDRPVVLTVSPKISTNHWSSSGTAIGYLQCGQGLAELDVGGLAGVAEQQECADAQVFFHGLESSCFGVVNDSPILWRQDLSW